MVVAPLAALAEATVPNVARKAIPTAKSGKTYLAATFTDKTGELEARSFDKVEELGALFEEKDHVEVEGLDSTGGDTVEGGCADTADGPPLANTVSPAASRSLR